MEHLYGYAMLYFLKHYHTEYLKSNSVFAIQ